jgi:hypothetical protein
MSNVGLIKPWKTYSANAFITLSLHIMGHLGENSTHHLLCTHPSLLLHIHDKTTEMSFSLKCKILIKISKVQAYESLAGSIP